ncbi:GNAT family N-acetyltransferase [Flexivirga sp. ID2601S]|uniref:GNAT family N-acetyltransferase n=1 Tax=Flexivirga aerilata TaxID=1656889 RepID=A0A849AIG2_9MICO|nr:GNAT family N-acetyltransferase [Flexivirga aerilata]NNG40235.1 GNAT family N-acetyltransferase [Flexivirga aerilata]
MPRFPQDVPRLTGEGVLLRAHTEADIPRIVSSCNDRRSRQWLSLPAPYAAEQARDYLAHVAQGWADESECVWAVEAAGQYAGSITLHRRSPAAREVGYLTHPDSRGQGVTSAAVRRVVRHAFEDMQLPTVTWRAGRGNWGSRRAAWAAGFTVDGVWPAQATDGHGAPEDLWVGHVHAEGWTGAPTRPWWKPKVLEKNGIRLRPWRADDHLQEPDDGMRLMATRMQPTPGDFPAWLLRTGERMASGAAVVWCVADAAHDEPLGQIQVTGLDVDFIAGTGEVGYWLYPHARGRGVMTTALELVREHAFAERTDESGTTGLGLHRLQAGTDARNQASERTLRRAGFRSWGTERSVLRQADGSHTDALNWELLATDDVAAQAIWPRDVPVLEDETIRLRPWRESDREALPSEIDELARTFMPAGAQPTPDTFDAWFARRRRNIDSGSAVAWCIADPATDRAVGDMLLFGIGDGTATSAEIGYWLLPDARGHGYLQQALELVVPHAFSSVDDGGMGLTRLHAATDLANAASQALLTGAGFRRWGQDRQAYTGSDGTISDGAYFELLSSDDRESRRSATPPALDFPDVRLRPLRRDDVGPLARTWADPEIAKWLSIAQDDLGAQAADYVRAKRYADPETHGLWWVVCAAESDDFAGVAGLQHITGGPASSAEVGYWLAPDARGHGLATAAVRALVAFAFLAPGRGGLGVRRVTAGVGDGNTASLRALQSAGLQVVGRARQAEALGDGSVVDLLLLDRVAPGTGEED